MSKKFLLTLALACFTYTVNLRGVQAGSSSTCNCPDYETILKETYSNMTTCLAIPGQDAGDCFSTVALCSLAAACDLGMLDDTCKTYTFDKMTFKDLCLSYGGPILQ